MCVRGRGGGWRWWGGGERGGVDRRAAMCRQVSGSSSFLITLDSSLKGPLRLELSDTHVCEPKTRARMVPPAYEPLFISHKVFLKSFCKSEFQHEFVNFFSTLVKVEDTLTDLWGS